jgi:hypothetical protein
MALLATSVAEAGARTGRFVSPIYKIEISATFYIWVFVLRALPCCRGENHCFMFSARYKIEISATCYLYLGFRASGSAAV